MILYNWKKFHAFTASFLLGVVGVSCATRTLSVQSSPEGAEVFIVHENQQPVRVGATPLFTDSAAIMNAPGDVAKILIRKENFATESILIPKAMVPAAVRVSVEMKEQKLPAACLEQDKAMERIARNVALAQSQLQAKKFDLAERNLLLLADEYPTSSVVQDLLGNTYYLLRDLGKARRAYEKSLELNPNNPETQRMVEKLKTLSGSGERGGN